MEVYLHKTSGILLTLIRIWPTIKEIKGLHKWLDEEKPIPKDLSFGYVKFEKDGKIALEHVWPGDYIAYNNRKVYDIYKQGDVSDKLIWQFSETVLSSGIKHYVILEGKMNSITKRIDEYAISYHNPASQFWIHVTGLSDDNAYHAILSYEK